MNPNELKQGDRIMIPATVTQLNYDDSPQPHRIKLDEGLSGDAWISEKTLAHAQLIPPSRVADKWEPKVGETHSFDDCGIILSGKVISKHDDMFWVEVPATKNYDKCMATVSLSRFVKPIPTAPTMEEELGKILRRTPNFGILHSDILAWHTKHQPSVPSYEEFNKYYYSQYKMTIKEAWQHFGLDKLARKEKTNEG